MELSKIFNYEGNEVTFRNEQGVIYVNATQMAKKFNKRPNDYLNTQSAQELIKAITSENGNAVNQPVITINGGLNPATWLTEEVALDFAQWLSVSFRRWCNKMIKELLTTGSVSIQEFDIPTKLSEALRLAADKQEIVEQQAEQLRIQAPKVEYVEKLLKSETTFSTTELAADFGMSAKKLNKELLHKGVIRKMREGYVLTAKYLNRGYEYMLPVEKEGASIRQLRWTERGRAAMHHLFGVDKALYAAQGKLEIGM